MDSSSCLKIVSAGGFGAGGLPHTSALVMSAVPIGPEQDPSKLLPSDILRHRFTPPWVKRPQGDGHLARRRMRHRRLHLLLGRPTG